MKYAIQGFIKTNNTGRRNAISQILPSVDDSKVSIIDYVNEDTVDEDGSPYMIFDIKFETKNDRDILFSTLKSLEGIIRGCESGSHIKIYKFNHAEGIPCQLESEIRKD
jgi:vesicle coat complex subunit